MAKKFVKVTGLNKVFDTIDASGNATIKSGVSAADSNSILFIEATTDDSSKFSSLYNVAGSRWIWAQGKLYDANTPLFQKLTSIESSSDAIADNDSVELILRKLKYQVDAASKAGVQSLTSSTDSWITVDPKLDASTGAVNLSIGHAVAGEVSTSIAADISIVNNGDYNFNFKIPQINVDSKGHFVVNEDSSTTTSIILDACEGSIVHFTCDNDKKLGVTIATAGYTAYKAGDASNSYTLSSNASSFKIIDLSTDQYGFARKSNVAKITLPQTAFADTSYEFAGGTQSFTYKVKGSSDAFTTIGVSHMEIGSGKANADDGKYISDVCIDGYGHVIGVASKTNGVYSDDTSLHAAGELAVWDVSTNKLKTSEMTIRSSSIGDNSSTTTTIPTTAQVIEYVIANKVSGAMAYKGTFSSSAGLPKNASIGDTYVLNTSTKIGEVSCQVGDMFIYNDSSKWDRIPAGDTTVENKNAIITENDTTLAVIDGVPIKAKVYAASTTQKGIVQLSDSTNISESSTAATSKAVYDVSEAAHKVKFDGSIKSASDGSYILGSFTNAAGTTTTIYGQDTKYVHPAVSSATNAVDTSAGTVSATNVITSVYIDVSGHVGKVVTSDISAAYNKRAVKVNGTSLIESSADTALNISAGTNVTLTTSSSEGSVTIAASDEKVKSTTISSSVDTGYLLATTESNESTGIAVKNASVTINGAGKLSAVSLYEGVWSIHDSSAGDWGEIK